MKPVKIPTSIYLFPNWIVAREKEREREKDKACSFAAMKARPVSLCFLRSILFPITCSVLYNP